MGDLDTKFVIRNKETGWYTRAQSVDWTSDLQSAEVFTMDPSCICDTCEEARREEDPRLSVAHHSIEDETVEELVEVVLTVTLKATP